MKPVQRLCRSILLLIAIFLVAVMAGCGGSSGGSSAAGATTISGTAAAGAPIIGSVTVKDSTTPTAQTKTVQIAADGKYTVDVSGMKAPLMVRADGYVGGNEYHLYSAATAADVGGTINVTPLTDLIVANIAKTIASDYYSSGNYSTLSATDLTNQTNALATKLQPILSAVGVSSSIDLLRTSFATDHTGLDAALDVIRVSTDTTTNTATISNLLTTQTVTSNLTTQTYTSTLTSATTTAVASGVTDIQAISNGFQTITNLFATSLPSPTNTTLTGLFDSATFLDEGQDLPTFLSQMTSDKSMIGVSFNNISFQSMDTTNGTAVVAFDVIQNGTIINDGPKPFHLIKKSDGKWYMQGDQYIAHVRVRSRAENQIGATSSPIVTGLDLDIQDRGGKGITSAVVNGPGLPSAGVTLINNTAYNYFEISGQQYGGSLYVMNDAAIGQIPDTGAQYTVALYGGTTLMATYTETLKKRPYLNSELSSASFPAITYPTMADLQSLIGTSAVINGKVTWTLPAGTYNDWLDVYVADNSGNSARYETGLTPTQTSASFTLNPVTSTGTPFTITNGWIWLGVWDSYGRELATSM